MAVAQSEAVSASDADAQLVPGLHWRWSPAMAAALQAAPNRPQASASGAAPLLSPGALLGASPGASPGASLGASPLPHRRPHWDQASPAQMEADIAMCQEATDAAVASLLAAVRRAHEDEEHALQQRAEEEAAAAEAKERRNREQEEARAAEAARARLYEEQAAAREQAAAAARMQAAQRGRKDRKEAAEAKANFDAAAAAIATDVYYPMTSPPRSSSSPKRKGKSPEAYPSPPWQEKEIDEERVLRERRKRQQQAYMEKLEARQAGAGSSGSVFGGPTNRLRGGGEGHDDSGALPGAPSPLPVPPPILTQDSAETAQRNARRILKLERYNKDFDLEDAINTANALHRTLMERELPISQDGYAKAASILHRKNKTSAPRVVQGMQQQSTACLVLQAGARGFIARQYARLQEEQRRATCDSAAVVLVDFFARVAQPQPHVVRLCGAHLSVQASTKIASVMRGKRARGSLRRCGPPSCVLSRRRRSAFSRPTFREAERRRRREEGQGRRHDG